MARPRVASTCLHASFGMLVALAAPVRGASPAEIVSIADVAARPPSARQAAPPLSTAALPTRATSERVEIAPGVVVVTDCTRNACVDGLMIDGHVALAAAPTADERAVVSQPGSHLERVLRVAFVDARFVSVYVATDWLTAGAAHANAALSCRTFDRVTGRLVTLADVVPARIAASIVRRAHALLDEETALQVWGAGVDAAGFTFEPQSFRWAPGTAAVPALVLCGQGPYPHRSSSVVELRVDDIPLAFLLAP